MEGVSRSTELAAVGATSAAITPMSSVTIPVVLRFIGYLTSLASPIPAP